MRPTSRDFFIVLACFMCFQLYYFIHRNTNRPCELQHPRSVVLPEAVVNEEVAEKKVTLNPQCDCKSEKTGKIHNFCYIDPQNKTSIGKKFDCSSLEHLENFGIFDFSQEFVDTSKPTRIDKDVVFGSASSDDHFSNTQVSFGSLRKFYPNNKYILYSLGLNSTNRAAFEKNDNVEVRNFDFSKYPNYTSQIFHYRWKVLFVSELLKEYPNVWWVDAHLKTVKAFTDTVYQERAAKKVASDVVLAFASFHSNFATMIPAVYNHIPTNSVDLLKSKEKSIQFGGGFLYVARTRQSLEIYKWFLLCALDETCMNPPTAQIYCKFGANCFDYFANCFRFDQSIINLLLLNEFQDYHKYVGSINKDVARL